MDGGGVEGAAFFVDGTVATVRTAVPVGLDCFNAWTCTLVNIGDELCVDKARASSACLQPEQIMTV